MRLLALLLCIILALGAAQAAMAQEKLVAIVFDTSGSMGTRIELPSFGVQLLTATLDGRSGKDRLYSINFTDHMDDCVQNDRLFFPTATTISQMPCDTSRHITRFLMTDERSHAIAIRTLRDQYTAGAGATPFAPLEIMLDRLAQDVAPGEEIVLIVVVDGDYSDSVLSNGAMRSTMKQSFEVYRDRILANGGRISAKFMFIDDTGSREAIVREQAVRDTLLSVFNDDASDGAWHVTGREALWDAMTDIIAEVSGTDREAQSAFISYSGNTISVNSPLSISRVVVTSTGRAGAQLPVLQSDTFPVSPSLERSLTTEMPRGDYDFGGVRLGGAVKHLWFDNPVPAGTYDLKFSGPVNPDEVFLLFETQSITDLRIFESDGAEVVPDSSGQITLFTDTDYTFVSRILDGVGTLQPIELDALPANMTMQLALTGSGTNDVRSMTIDRVADQGVVAYRPAQTGSFQAISRASAGILSPESDQLSIVVLEARTDLTVTRVTSVVDCSTCAAGEVISPVTALDGADVEIGFFEVAADATIDGAVTFAGSGLPPGYVLRDEQGRTVDLNQPVPFGAAQTQEFSIFRPANMDMGDLADGTNIDIKVTPTGLWTGTPAEAETRVTLSAADMGMALINVTQSPTPGQLDGLLVPSRELLRGQFSAFFSLTDLLVAPDPARIDDLVSVTAPGFIGGLVDFENTFADPRTTGAHAIDARPTTSYWCLCFLGISNKIRGTEARDYTMTYKLEVDGVVLQQASVPLAVHTPVQNTQFTLSCVLDAFLLLLMAMFVRGISALIFTHRFPKGSVMEIVEGRSVPRFKRLDRGNSVWWKAWFALFTGNPDEVRVVEGLKIKATGRGAIVDLTKSAPPWVVERFGESFAELKESRHKTTQHKLIWGDRMENTMRSTLSMILKKRSSE